MSGVDTVRGVTYQHCQAILTALDVAGDETVLGIRVEGTVDALDLEVMAEGPSGHGPVVVRGLQMKSRLQPYTWGRSELLSIVGRWAKLPLSATSEFTFLTDGRLGSSGQKVASALNEARRGQYGAVADLLEVSIDDPLCTVMSRARVVSDPSSVEALLHSAEVEIQALLEIGHSHPDAKQVASDRVSELFRTISIRSGMPDLNDRFISRDDIASILGGVAHLTEADRWTSSLANEYLALASAEDVSELISPKLSASWQETPISLEELRSISGPILVAGRTGSGKSTLSRLWRRAAADKGTTVIVCHAEAYLARKLDRLVADAVGSLIGRALPRAVGRQVLSDQHVNIVIDGVSELPREVRNELATELRAHLAGSHGAEIVAVGRDEAQCATIFPASLTVQRLYPLSFGPDEQLALAAKILNRPDSTAIHEATSEVSSTEFASQANSERDDREKGSLRYREMLAQVEHVLGDAVGNPMLLEMALRLISSGASFTDRASVYELTVSRLANRANAGDVRIAVSLLGVVYSELLNEGRRYADPLEWELKFARAAELLDKRGVTTDVPTVYESVARSGLINSVVVGLGQTTLRVPVHDSFADYFAARAHADGLVELPEALRANDENRLWLSSQMQMLSNSEVLTVARLLPFMLVRISESDHNAVDEQSLALVVDLLNSVLPAVTDVHVTMWRTSGGETMAQSGAATRWVNPAEAPAIFDGLTVVGDSSEGPTAIAVRLWRLILQHQLSSDQQLPPRPARTRQEACDQLNDHCRKTATAVTTILAKVSPPGAIGRLRDSVGPLGMTGVVYERHQGGFGPEVWPVRYRHSEGFNVAAAPDSSPPPAERTEGYTAWTDVDSRVSTSPEATAATAVAKAITKLTRNHWL